MTKLAFECPADWNAMTPVAGGRHCATCDKTVVDVRRKTRAQFDAICKGAGELCVRANANALGELVFMPTPKRRLPLVAQAAFSLALAACATSDTTVETLHAQNALLGEVAAATSDADAGEEAETPPELGDGLHAIAGGIRPMPAPEPTPQPADRAPHGDEHASDDPVPTVPVHPVIMGRIPVRQAQPAPDSTPDDGEPR